MGVVFASFDGLPIVLYDSTSDVGTGVSNTPVFPLASGGVFDPLGSEQAVRGAMPISITGDLVADDADDMSTQQRAWRAKRGKRGKLVRRWLDTDAAEWVYARLPNVDIQRGPDNALVQPITLNFIAESPVWNGVHHGAGWLLDSGILLDEGYYLDEGVTYDLEPGGITPPIAIAYGGDAIVTNVVLTIHNPTAGATNITLVGIKIGPDADADGVADEYESAWTYDEIILPGQDLVIDCGRKRVTNIGVGDYANFEISDGLQLIDPWMRFLPVGQSVISVTMVGGPSSPKATLSVDFHEGFS